MYSLVFFLNVFLNPAEEPRAKFQMILFFLVFVVGCYRPLGRLAGGLCGAPKCSALFTVLLSRELRWTPWWWRRSMTTVRVAREQQGVFFLTADTDEGLFLCTLT